MSESIKERMASLANVSDAFHLRKAIEAVREELVDLRALANDARTVVNNIYGVVTGNYIITPPGLAMGSTKQNVANNLFYYSIAGQVYAKAAIAAGTAPGNDVIPQGKYGAVAFDIGTNGTIDAIEATANATGYASAVLAKAGLPAPASGHARIGYVTATSSSGAFTFGTTAFDAANTTVVYTGYTTMIGAINSLDNITEAAVSEALTA